MRSQTQYKQPISKPDIHSVLERENVKLYQKGQNFWARCPLHSERTPSFKVDSDRQTFYCFGCQEHGDVVTFVRLLHGLSFREALTYLDIDRSNYRPDPLKVYNNKLKKAYIEDFRTWEKEYRDLLAYLLRMGRQQTVDIKTVPELEKWGSLLHDFDYYEYVYEILCSNDDKEKYELFREEARC